MCGVGKPDHHGGIPIYYRCPHDPALLDEPPTAAAVLVGAPERIKAALIDAFGIQALYNKDMDQVAIRASLTEDTPGPSSLCSSIPALTTGL